MSKEVQYFPWRPEWDRKPQTLWDVIRAATPDVDEAMVAWDRDVVYNPEEWANGIGYSGVHSIGPLSSWSNDYNGNHTYRHKGQECCDTHSYVFVNPTGDRETWYVWHPSTKHWARCQSDRTLTERREDGEERAFEQWGLFDDL